MNKQIVYKISLWSMILGMFVVSCYPDGVPIEVTRETVTTITILTPTIQPVKFVNYVLPPQAKPHLKDFYDYAYFLHTSDTSTPLVCVSWRVENFYQDENFDRWLVARNSEYIELTVDGVILPYSIGWQELLILSEERDGKTISYPEPSLNCWEYEPVLGEHEAVFSLRRTNDQIITYSWKFTVIE